MTGHVVLVGLSGSGKSSVGRRVAAQLGCPFRDSDDEIEQRAGRTVRDIFATDGEPAFRELEAEVMADLLAGDEPSVIAAGGGAVVTESTRKLLYEPDVFVVWLTASPAFLASRSGKKPHRPLLDDDPVAALSRLLEERRIWYEAVSDIAYDVQPDHEAAPKPQAKDNIAKAVAALVPA
jgi:shikimate kinase